MKRLVFSFKKHLKILAKMWSISIQEMAAFKASFFFMSFSISLWLVADILWVLLLFLYTDSFAGYALWQFIGFTGFYFGIINVYWLFFENGVHSLPDSIYEGKIDMQIVKPANSQFLVSFNKFDLPSLVNIIFGFFVFIFSLAKVDNSVTLYGLFVLITVSFLSLVIIYSISFIVMSSSFWLGRLFAVGHLLSTLINDIPEIPTNVYKGGLRFVLYFIIPFAAMTTVPTSALYFGISWWYVLYYFLFAVIIFAISRFVWKRGLRVYASVSG